MGGHSGHMFYFPSETQRQLSLMNRWWAGGASGWGVGQALRFLVQKIKQPGACLFCMAVMVKKKCWLAIRPTPLTLSKNTSSMPGAITTTTEAQQSVADRVCNHKVHICSFIAEHDVTDHRPPTGRPQSCPTPMCPICVHTVFPLIRKGKWHKLNNVFVKCRY